jgi:hypothetical protein
MTYPLINGELINGAESSDAYTDTGSIGPARFGTHQAVALQSAAPLAPVRFGMPRVKEGTDRVAEPVPLQPSRFGQLIAAPGVRPPAVSADVAGLRPVRFGIPSAASKASAGPVAGLGPARFGAAHVVVQQAVAGLGPTRFGAPGAGASASVLSLRPASFGLPHAVFLVAPAPLLAGRFGMPSIHIGEVSAQVLGLQPVGFGTPWVGGLALRARPLAPARFGRPTADRGQAC